jgi:polysaccharide deacetylase family protein (PEP-CTERM system associated)
MISRLTSSDNGPAVPAANAPSVTQPAYVILSFDVEEHYRIEAAAGVAVASRQRDCYRQRLGPSTYWLLEQLAAHAHKATFFVVAKIAEHNPTLIRAIHEAGHEVASHGWDHQRVHNFTPAAFRADIRRSKDTLEQLIGAAIVGYRAPTFSIVRQTAWAIDALVELGMHYDSSIYPVHHDLYGVPQAPRTPFFARGQTHGILEIPPATLRISGVTVPVGGGGYFRLLPLAILKHALRHAPAANHSRISMLYFHPWEFDPQQARLPMKPLGRFRTYFGIHWSRPRLAELLAGRARYTFIRALDAAALLDRRQLPEFDLVVDRPPLLQGTTAS